MKKNLIKLWTNLAFAPVLASMVLAACSPVMTAHLETGKKASRDGDYKTAVQHLRPLADFGIPEAQYELAQAFLKNKNATVSDKRQGKALLINLAEKGDERALYDLGRYYRDEKDYDNAIFYYTKSAEAGNVRAYFELGAIEEKKKNPAAALALYKKAFEGHYYRAAARIARLYEKGVEGNPDTAEALRWYEIALQNGETGVEENIAKLKSPPVTSK